MKTMTLVFDSNKECINSINGLKEFMKSANISGTVRFSCIEYDWFYNKKPVDIHIFEPEKSKFLNEISRESRHITAVIEYSS